MNDDEKVLMVLAQVQGQLATITQVMAQNHDATHQRINDLRHSVEGRITGVEARIDRVELGLERAQLHERASSLKTAGAGAAAGSVMAAGIELFKYFAGH